MGRVKEFLLQIEDRMAALLLAGVLVCLILQVVTRYVFKAPLSWTEEVSRHLFVWLVFFGASGAVQTRRHIALDLVASRFSGSTRIVIDAVTALLALFFLANVFYWGTSSVVRMWGIPTATLEIPTGLVYLVFPVSAGLMIVRVLAQTCSAIRSRRIQRSLQAEARGMDL